MRASFTVEVIDGMAVVRRASDGQIICDGRIDPGQRLHDIRFAHPDYQKSNRTRQAAMRALQRSGYR